MIKFAAAAAMLWALSSGDAVAGIFTQHDLAEPVDLFVQFDDPVSTSFPCGFGCVGLVQLVCDDRDQSIVTTNPKVEIMRASRPHGDVDFIARKDHSVATRILFVEPALFVTFKMVLERHWVAVVHYPGANDRIKGGGLASVRNSVGNSGVSAALVKSDLPAFKWLKGEPRPLLSEHDFVGVQHGKVRFISFVERPEKQASGYHRERHHNPLRQAVILPKTQAKPWPPYWLIPIAALVGGVGFLVWIIGNCASAIVAYRAKRKKKRGYAKAND